MNHATLQLWAERAKARQAKLNRPKRTMGRLHSGKDVFYVLASDLMKLRRRLGRRLSALITVEEAHVLDVDECGRW